MENSTPLTRCDTCHTVFEVPSAILDSADSRVRCGECLQVFDASINLHTASRPDFSLVDETLVDGAPDSALTTSAAKSSASPTDGAAVRDLETATAGAVEKTKSAAFNKALTPSSATAFNGLPDKHSDGIVSGRINGGDPARHDDTADESHLEATMSDFDLFSDDASLPEVSYEFGDKTIDAIRLQFDSVEDVVDETLSDSLFPNEVTIDASGLDVGTDQNMAVVGKAAETETDEKVASDKQPEAGIDDVLRRSAKTDFVVEEGPRPETVEFDFSEGSAANGEAVTAASAFAAASATATATASSVTASAAAVTNQTPVATSTAGSEVANTVNDAVDANPVLAATPAERKPSRLGRYLLQASLVLLTMVLIAALYGYRERNNLVDNPLTRPFYSVWCSIKGCPVPARFDKSQLKVVEKNIFSHPTLDDALVITVLLENNADFEQRYPALFLWLSDSARRTVASNEFEPAVYLPENGLTAESVLAPGQQRRISIDVRDPGRRAVSLELSLR